jgi:hypothetical protein
VTTSVAVLTADGRLFPGHAPPLRIDAGALPSLVAEALASYAPDLQSPICVISGRGLGDAAFTTEEHFVPEGLGFAWAKLPAGAATCDEVNHEFGGYETEWLRQGLMGCSRPFFVSHGKDGPPAYFAPNMTNQQFGFTRGPDGRRTFNLSPDVKISVRKGQPKMVRFDVPRSQARPVWVSLAIHKLAFLAFWLCRGRVAFDAGFNPLRAFLTTPSPDTYRPYWEEMAAGSEPGVAVHFSLGFRGEVTGNMASTTLDHVAVALRVHNMRYRLTLMGEPPPESKDPAGGWHQWRDPAEKPPDTTPIVYAFDRFEWVP